MAEKILVAYGSKYGSSREVGEVIAEIIRETGLDAVLRPAGEVREIDRYTAIVLGGGIYAGRLHRDARRFLKRHREKLAHRPLALFALGPKTTEPADIADARKQLDANLKRVPGVTPSRVAIFGGVIDPAKLRFPLNRMPASDARDWDAIRAFARDAAALVEHRESGAAA